MGGRFEHWESMGEDIDLASDVAATLARLAVGDAPAEVVRAYLGARLVGIPKNGGGVRVLGCGGVRSAVWT